MPRCERRRFPGYSAEGGSMVNNGNDDLVPERCRLVLADGRPVAL